MNMNCMINSYYYISHKFEMHEIIDIKLFCKVEKYLVSVGQCQNLLLVLAPVRCFSPQQLACSSIQYLLVLQLVSHFP